MIRRFEYSTVVFFVTDGKITLQPQIGIDIPVDPEIIGEFTVRSLVDHIQGGIVQRINHAFPSQYIRVGFQFFEVVPVFILVRVIGIQGGVFSETTVWAIGRFDIVVKDEDKDTQWAKDIVAAYQSDEFTDWLKANNESEYKNLWAIPEY